MVVDSHLSRSSDCSSIMFSVVLLLSYYAFLLFCYSARYAALFFCLVFCCCCLRLLKDFPAELDRDCLSQDLRLRFAAPAAAAVAAGPAE